MKISEYQPGEYRTNGAEYRYFLPAPADRAYEIDSPALQIGLERAALALGEFSAMARLVPNVGLFISGFVNNEATLSTRIEGTEISMEDAFAKEARVAPEKKDDWLEATLYIRALNEAIAALDELPLCERLIRQTHATLLSSGRGSAKNPGGYRGAQNWIGGGSPRTAIFVPPPPQHIPGLMADLEKFLHNREHPLPDLARIGIAHYQFETIHPFLDGNGRIGRILIPLYLAANKLMEKPLLYMSAFFEKHRQAYYDKLTAVRERGDMAGWLLFFFEGAEKTAIFGGRALRDILQLKEDLERDIRAKTGGRANTNLRLLERSFTMPVFSLEDARQALGVSRLTAKRAVGQFLELGIARRMAARGREHVYVFAPYLDILKRDFDE